jgi:hypothetical protein
LYLNLIVIHYVICRVLVQLLVRKDNKHPLASTKEDIKMGRSELTNRLERWRDLQAVHMGSLTPSHTDQSPCDVEQEILFLPSYFSDCERKSLSLESLAVDESTMREENGMECILQLRRVTRIISGMHFHRRTNIRGQKEGTRSRSPISAAEFDRDNLLILYARTREALFSLNSENAGRFPPLTLDDLYLKPVEGAREIGETYRRADGPIWKMGASSRAGGDPELLNPSGSSHLAESHPNPLRDGISDVVDVARSGNGKCHITLLPQLLISNIYSHLCGDTDAPSPTSQPSNNYT